MSRYIRTAGTTGGGAAYADSNVCALLCSGAPSAMGVCCIRAEWETLYQCDAVGETNFGCCIEFTVDATKYRGFKLYLHGFCSSTCANCQIHFGVGSTACYCCCSNTSFCELVQCQSFSTSCLNRMFGGGAVTATLCCGSRANVEMLATAACEKNWIAYQRMMSGTSSCYNESVAISNRDCGIIWCDITRIKLWNCNEFVAKPGAYLAVFGLKTPTCSIAFNATKSEAQT